MDKISCDPCAMDRDDVFSSALQRAIDIAGSQRKLAEKMRAFGRDNASQQIISYWLNNSVPVPAEWWAAIEYATDYAVTRKDLRPDVFPSAHASHPNSASSISV